MLFKPKRQYAYSVLQFQRSLRERGTFEPLGVIVQDQSDKEMSLFLVYSDPTTPTGISDVGQSVLASLPQLVAKQVEEFVGSPDHLLDWLAQSNRGNVLLGSVQHTEAAKPVAEVAFDLFSRQVQQVRGDRPSSHVRARPTMRGFFENMPVVAVGG